MFLRYRLENELQNFEPDFTIINAFDVKETDWKKYGLNSENFIVFNIEKKIGIIGGTEYAGEMKKGIFFYVALLSSSTRCVLNALFCECF